MLQPEKHMDIILPNKKTKKKPKNIVKTTVPQVKNGKTIKIAVINK